MEDQQRVLKYKSGDVYILGALLKKREEIARVRTVWDLPSAQLNVHEEPYRSGRSPNEFNCKDRNMRLIEIQEFGVERGLGEQVRSYDLFDSEPRAGILCRLHRLPHQPNEF